LGDDAQEGSLITDAGELLIAPLYLQAHLRPAGQAIDKNGVGLLADRGLQNVLEQLARLLLR